MKKKKMIINIEKCPFKIGDSIWVIDKENSSIKEGIFVGCEYTIDNSTDYNISNYFIAIKTFHLGTIYRMVNKALCFKTKEDLYKYLIDCGRFTLKESKETN